MGLSDTTGNPVYTANNPVYSRHVERIEREKERSRRQQQEAVDDVYALNEAESLTSERATPRITALKKSKHDEVMVTLNSLIKSKYESCTSSIKSLAEQLCSTLQDGDRDLGQVWTELDNKEAYVVDVKDVESAYAMVMATFQQQIKYIENFKDNEVLVKQVEPALSSSFVEIAEIGYKLPTEIERDLECSMKSLNESILLARRDVLSMTKTLSDVITNTIAAHGAKYHAALVKLRQAKRSHGHREYSRILNTADHTRRDDVMKWYSARCEAMRSECQKLERDYDTMIPPVLNRQLSDSWISRCQTLSDEYSGLCRATISKLRAVEDMESRNRHNIMMQFQQSLIDNDVCDDVTAADIVSKDYVPLLSSFNEAGQAYITNIESNSNKNIELFNSQCEVFKTSISRLFDLWSEASTKMERCNSQAVGRLDVIDVEFQKRTKDLEDSIKSQTILAKTAKTPQELDDIFKNVTSLLFSIENSYRKDHDDVIASTKLEVADEYLDKMCEFLGVYRPGQEPVVAPSEPAVQPAAPVEPVAEQPKKTKKSTASVKTEVVKTKAKSVKSADGAQAKSADGAQAKSADGAQAKRADGAQVKSADGAQVKSAKKKIKKDDVVHQVSSPSPPPPSSEPPVQVPTSPPKIEVTQIVLDDITFTLFKLPEYSSESGDLILSSEIFRKKWLKIVHDVLLHTRAWGEARADDVRSRARDITHRAISDLQVRLRMLSPRVGRYESDVIYARKIELNKQVRVQSRYLYTFSKQLESLRIEGESIRKRLPEIISKILEAMTRTLSSMRTASSLHALNGGVSSLERHRERAVSAIDAQVEILKSTVNSWINLVESSRTKFSNSSIDVPGAFEIFQNDVKSAISRELSEIDVARTQCISMLDGKINDGNNVYMLVQGSLRFLNNSKAIQNDITMEQRQYMVKYTSRETAAGDAVKKLGALITTTGGFTVGAPPSLYYWRDIFTALHSVIIDVYARASWIDCLPSGESSASVRPPPDGPAWDDITLKLLISWDQSVKEVGSGAIKIATPRPSAPNPSPSPSSSVDNSTEAIKKKASSSSSNKPADVKKKVVVKSVENSGTLLGDVSYATASHSTKLRSLVDEFYKTASQDVLILGLVPSSLNEFNENMSIFESKNASNLTQFRSSSIRNLYDFCRQLEALVTDDLARLVYARAMEYSRTILENEKKDLEAVFKNKKLDSDKTKSTLSQCMTPQLAHPTLQDQVTKLREMEHSRFKSYGVDLKSYYERSTNCLVRCVLQSMALVCILHRVINGIVVLPSTIREVPLRSDELQHRKLTDYVVKETKGPVFDIGSLKSTTWNNLVDPAYVKLFNDEGPQLKKIPEDSKKKPANSSPSPSTAPHPLSSCIQVISRPVHDIGSPLCIARNSVLLTLMNDLKTMMDAYYVAYSEEAAAESKWHDYVLTTLKNLTVL